MAEPDWNPDTAGRPLAEILREAGIESAARAGRRRRWDDPAESGLRQRRAEAAADTAAGPNPGRRASDLAGNGLRRPPPEPSTAAIPGLRPSRTPEVPTAATPAVAAPAQRDRRTDGTDRRTDGTDRPPDGTDRRSGGTDRRSGGTDRRPVEKARPAGERDRRLPGRPVRKPEAEDFSTGPIPIVRDGEVPEEEASPRESALAWLRFAGELVIALAAGVGVYFLATVLWEQIPELAVLLTPLAVTGLVAGVGMWRQRMGREPMGTLLLAVLVFAGALLTVAPAASLLAG